MDVQYSVGQEVLVCHSLYKRVTPLYIFRAFDSGVERPCRDYDFGVAVPEYSGVVFELAFTGVSEYPRTISRGLARSIALSDPGRFFCLR